MNMLMGMAKPIPSLPPELLAMAVLMPMTSPWRLTSGPPLLPGLMAASVCRKSWKRIFVSPSGRSRRPLALMIPNVTEWLRPKGLPTASTKSPISIRSLSPNGAATRSGAEIGITATSVSASSKTFVGWMRRPSARLILIDCRRSVADDVPVGQHVVLILQLDDHAGAGLFHVPAAAVLRVGVGRNVGLDVDHRRADQLGDDLHHGRLGFEHLGMCAPIPAAIRPAAPATAAAGRSSAAGKAEAGVWARAASGSSNKTATARQSGGLHDEGRRETGTEWIGRQHCDALRRSPSGVRLHDGARVYWFSYPHCTRPAAPNQASRHVQLDVVDRQVGVAAGRIQQPAPVDVGGRSSRLGVPPRAGT